MRQVVAVALIRGAAGDRKVLAARRSAPLALAGLWEFPGGKVEPGEGPRAAVRRECREELGVEVRVGAKLAPQLEVPGAGGPLLLTLYRGAVLRGEPQPREHAALRWLGLAELGSVTWLPADLPLVEAVGELLRR
jgi:8-oxo-dGTP diphosphatase